MCKVEALTKFLRDIYSHQKLDHLAVLNDKIPFKIKASL